MKHKTFTADIYETDQIMQTVIAYVTDEDAEFADVTIKIPLYIQPSALRCDVETWLGYAYNLKLGYMTYELAPQNTYIAI